MAFWMMFLHKLADLSLYIEDKTATRAPQVSQETPAAGQAAGRFQTFQEGPTAVGKPQAPTGAAAAETCIGITWIDMD